MKKIHVIFVAIIGMMIATTGCATTTRCASEHPYTGNEQATTSSNSQQYESNEPWPGLSTAQFKPHNLLNPKVPRTVDFEGLEYNLDYGFWTRSSSLLVKGYYDTQNYTIYYIKNIVVGGVDYGPLYGCKRSW